MRVRDDHINEMVQSGELQEDDLPEGLGTIPTDDFGVRSTGYSSIFSKGHPVPPPMQFHSTSRAAWRNVAEQKWVPFDDKLESLQGDVSAGRIEELRQDPSSGDSGRLPYPELPRVYENESGDHYIVDGNHRTMAAKARGQLFFEARVARPEMVPDFNERYRRLLYAQQGAAENHNIDAAQMDLYERWEPTDSMWRDAAQRIKGHNPPVEGSELPRRRTNPGLPGWDYTEDR